MHTNMDVLFCNHIPISMQGRVFSARNTLQLFTIPIGYFLDGFLIDKVFEPLHLFFDATALLFISPKSSEASVQKDSE